MAWVAAQGDDIVALIGAKRPDRLAEAVVALDLQLSSDDLADIERAVPPRAAVGERYNVHGMAPLDSDRGLRAARAAQADRPAHGGTAGRARRLAPLGTPRSTDDEVHVVRVGRLSVVEGHHVDEFAVLCLGSGLGVA